LKHGHTAVIIGNSIGQNVGRMTERKFHFQGFHRRVPVRNRRMGGTRAKAYVGHQIFRGQHGQQIVFQQENVQRQSQVSISPV